MYNFIDIWWYLKRKLDVSIEIQNKLLFVWSVTRYSTPIFYEYCKIKVKNIGRIFIDYARKFHSFSWNGFFINETINPLAYSALRNPRDKKFH